MLVNEGLEVLEEEECFRLLASETFGRVEHVRRGTACHTPRQLLAGKW